MTLFIQKDESLRSFLARYIFLFPCSEKAHEFSRVLRRRMHTQDLRLLANVMGWEGCYGFNRLVHNHYEDPLHFIFKSARDISYSQKWYIEKAPLKAGNNYSFCPLCVREDVSRAGYSYWRRWWSGQYDVCGTHNVVLQNECPHCQAPFSPGGHDLDVMWAGCSGRPLTENSVEFNSNPTAYRRIKFVEKACAYGHYIPLEVAIKSAAKRLDALQSSQEVGTRHSYVEYYLGRTIRDYNQAVNPKHFAYGHGLYLPSIHEAYDSFEQLITDVFSCESPTRNIEMLWSTYQASGRESACFIDEQYKYGVGLWSCPYPSDVSNHQNSSDAWDARTPKIYSCCNFLTEASLLGKPKAKKIIPAAPAIRLER